MDSRRSQPASLHTTSSLTALPERVTELFSMLDGEHFFRSPFIRHKIVVPNLLFTNGTTGLDPIFTSESASSSSTDSNGGHSPGRGKPAPFSMHVPASAATGQNSSKPLFSQDGSSERRFMDAGGVVRNIPIRLMTTTPTDNKTPSKKQSNNTTINFSPTQASKPISNSLLKNVLQHRNPSEEEDSDSPSLRSAPPEQWQHDNSAGSNWNRTSFNDGEDGGDLMARRKLSTPKDLFSHSSMLSPRGQQQNSTHTNPVPRQLSEDLSGPTAMQRRNFFWQPQRDQKNEVRSGEMSQRDELSQRWPGENERNSNASAPVNFRSVPIVQLNLSKGQENSFGNGVKLDYNSNSTTAWQQQRSSTPGAGESPLEDNNSKPYYSAIPFRRPPSTTREVGNGRSDGSNHSSTPITSAISTPSLLTSSSNQKPAVSFVKRQQKPSKRAFYQSNEKEKLEEQQGAAPSFLRRTQTAYSVPSGHLPRRDSEPSVIIAANDSFSPTTNNNYLSGDAGHHHSNRRSLHETSFQQQPPPPSDMNPPTRSKSPSMASLRQSLKSFSNKPKKITFVPSCVRGNQPNSSDEDEDETRRSRRLEEEAARLTRSRSPSLTASSLRLTEFVPSEGNHAITTTPACAKEDSVEEAIRSLESFDPNDYYIRSQKDERDHPQQYAVNDNTSSPFYRQPQSISSDEEALPPPPPLPQLTSRYLAQPPPATTSRIQERHWNTAAKNTPCSAQQAGTEHLKESPSQRDSALSTLTSSSTTSSPDSSTSSTNSQQDSPSHKQPSQTSSVWQADNSSKEQPSKQPQPPASKANYTSGAGVNFRRPSTSSTTPTITSSGSATPTGPQLIVDTSFNRSFENRTPRANTPTHPSSILSPSSTMGNSNGVVYIGHPRAQHNHRNSTSSPGYQPQQSHTSSSVPFEMDQLLNKLKNDRRNAQTPTNIQPVMDPPYCSPDYEDNEEDDIEAAAEAEAHLRKRFLCTQLTDCAKVVEINAHKMSQFAAAGGGGWRQDHILRHNLAAIRDTVYTIEFALEELVDALARICLERDDPKAAEFHQLSAPLFTSQSLIRRLRANLDGTGWSLQALARQTAAPVGANDALDQFVAILRQLPRDCYKLVQWIYLLGVWNNGGAGPAVFLSTSTHPHSHSVPPPPAPQPYALNNAQRYSTTSPSTSNESPRNSIVTPPSAKPSSLSTRPVNPPKVNFQPKSVNTSKPVETTVLQPPTMAEINMDGGESTTSSNTSSLNMEEDIVAGQQLTSNKSHNSVSPKLNSSNKKKLSVNHEEPEEASKVYEEDDLMSVASESIDSLYGDYTMVGGDHSSRPGSASSGNVAMVRPQPKSSLGGTDGATASPRETRRRGVPTPAQLELAKGLGEEERDLMIFYQPQIEANTAELCRLVEDFFTIVEEHQAAKSFVQKIQMICIKTQTLVCIARMVTKDDITTVSKKLHDFLAEEANSLDALLNECVGSARIAKDKSQSVAAVQQMVSSVMAVSQAVLNLKLFWKSCV